MKFSHVILFMIIILSHSYGQIDSTSIINSKQEYTLGSYTLIDKDGVVYVNADINKGISQITINGDNETLDFVNGLAKLNISNDAGLQYISTSKSSKLYHVAKSSIKNIPLWLSLVPPLLAIILALVFKEVTVSLFIGVWSGSFIASGFRWNSIFAWFDSLLNSVSKYIIEALTDGGHISVIVFSLMIGGIVAIISKNGGMAGIVEKLSRYAKSPRSTQFVTWLLGIAIFFDDYANTLIVGNTMRSVTDKFKISREKLAYIVDSTAAPVSAIAFITTWIGAELGYIGDGMASLNLEATTTPYAIFLSSLKYSFYPILTLLFILILIYTKKDFGQMLVAETRARKTGRVSPAKTANEDEPDMEDLSPVKNAPNVWWHAALPILTIILMTILGLLMTGYESAQSSLSQIPNAKIGDSWSTVWSQIPLISGSDQTGFFSKLGYLIGAADSYQSLLWSSLCGLLVAILITVSKRIMSLFETMHWMATGFKTMLPAIIILTLAWALAITTNEIHTADFISSGLQDNISPYLFPAIIFVLAALIAFSTGSSWSTMAILYPIAIPTCHAICTSAGIPADLAYEILLAVIATVLGASVLGDHCSPISDTSILSSLASDCNHIDHVRTQLPYALLVGMVSILGITISILLGGGGLICFILFVISILVLYGIVQWKGRLIPENNG